MIENQVKRNFAVSMPSKQAITLSATVCGPSPSLSRCVKEAPA